MLCGKMNRLSKLYSKPTTEMKIFVTLQSAHSILAMAEKLANCEMRKEDGSQNLFFQGIVSPVERFHEATVLWVAHALVHDNYRTCRARLLNITKDEIMTNRTHE